jgi:hypothetical protein
VVLALASLGSRAQAPRAAPRASNPATTATPLVNRFFTLVEHQDTKGLDRFLSSAFQLERADGSGGTKAQYLANLPRSRASPSRA